MFDRVLVANRGEIAARLLRTLRDMRIQSVAVFTEGDTDANYLGLCDDAVPLKGTTLQQTYLNGEALLAAARASGASAIVPGYGFLSENAAFAAACEQSGITFVGPNPRAIELMGIKTRARDVAQNAGVPLVPGGPAQTLAQAQSSAATVGFPVLIKAAAGGGGKGMRLVTSPEELSGAYEAAARESERAFGSGEVYIERALLSPKHIEVQLLGDKHGNIVHLGERDCSVQRRHQKIVEETPAPVLSPKMRQQMTKAAVRLARAVNYDSAGTVEFLVEGEEFFFLEMNTRLQVEHTVTELVTGMDLVEQMLRAAASLPLEVKQSDILTSGYAIQCRVCAETPRTGFLPSTGTIEAYEEPSGPFVRVDGGVAKGYTVTTAFDPLLAKLCTWGQTRDQARRRMLRALSEYSIAGLDTNLRYLSRVVDSDEFTSGTYNTKFVEQNETLRTETVSTSSAAKAAALAEKFRTEQRQAQQPVASPPAPWSGRTYTA